MNEQDDEIKEIISFDKPLEGIKKIFGNELEGRIDYDSLFSSEDGKKLSRQIEDQKQFTTVGMLLPLIQDLMKRIYPRLSNLFSDIRFRQAMDESIQQETEITPEERELMTRFPDLVQYMLKTMEQNGETSFEIPWGEKAVERYIGSFVLSLHTYIEAFVDSTIDRLIANQDSRTVILEYCDKHLRRRRINFAELEVVDGSKYEVISELVKRNLPLSLPKRMLFICDALGVRKKIDGFVEKEVEGEILDGFRQFCDLRNQIAHCEPAPNLSDYDIDTEPFNWKQMKGDLKRNLDDAEIEPPIALYEIIDVASEWGEQSLVAEYFLLLETVFEIAILFVAAFDYFVFSKKM